MSDRDIAALREELKALLVRELNLQDKKPADIDDEAPLFGQDQASGQGKGLGLDSLDALQLAMAIEERFAVRLPEGEQARPVFRSVAALAEHISLASKSTSGRG